MNEIPESLEVLEQGVNDLMKETDFETFVDSVLVAVVLSVVDIMNETDDKDKQVLMLTGTVGAATEKIVAAKDRDNG